MKARSILSFVFCGAIAGVVNGIFGAGGGMILIPLLTWLTDLKESEVFPTSVSIIAPICIVSLCATKYSGEFPWKTAAPYLAGSVIGGTLAGIFSGKIPTKILHRFLGIIIIWGGIRNLW